MPEEAIRIKIECGKCGEIISTCGSYLDEEQTPVFMLEPHECDPPDQE